MACSNDPSFGPAASCRTFDFTIGFEYRVLFVLHYSLCSSLLVQLTLNTLCKRGRVVKCSLDALLVAKLVVIALGVAATVAVLGIGHRALANVPGLQNWATAAYALQSVFTLIFGLASYFRHTRTIAPSTSLALSLLVSILFGIVHVRTLFMLSISTSLATFSALVLTWQCVHLTLELLPKRCFIDPGHLPVALESTSSILSRLFFTFLFPLLLRGKKQPFTLDELCAYGLPPELTAMMSGRALSSHLEQLKSRRTPRALFRTSLRRFIKPFLAPVVPKVLLVVATFAQPFIVQAMLKFISSYNSKNDTIADTSHGWALVGAYALVYLTMTVSTAMYYEKLYSAAMQYRAALITIILEKSLRLSASVAQTEGTGALVYMSVDVERVVEGTTYLHEAWAALLSIAAASIIMWHQASFAMLSTVGVVLVFLAITSCVASLVQRAQMDWMEATNKRIKFISSIVNSIVSIKLSAIEARFPDRTNKLRDVEVDKLKEFYFRLLSVAALSSATINVAGVAALGTYAAIGSTGPLDPAKLFTILTVVNLLTLPVSTIGHVFPQILASFASFKRIATFLNAEEKSDLDEGMNGRLLIPEKEATFQTHDIILSNASFAPEFNGQPILDVLNATIGAGKFTALIGPIASGKSLLLRSILRETHLVQGSCTFPALGSVSYAAQDPFIFPASIRANIVLNKPFDLTWYSTVITACQLGPDFTAMANGDMTRLGDKGNTLSGGQRQRIALARAVYARSQITLLDDSFSALDAHTSELVYSALLGTHGLLRGLTVILATHDPSHVKDADDVIVLDAGHIVAQGPMVDLSAINLQSLVSDGKKSSSTLRSLSLLDDLEDGDITEPLLRVSAPASVQQVTENTTEEDGDEDGSSLILGNSVPYMFYFRACGWRNLVNAVLALICSATLEVGLQIYLKMWSQSGSRTYTVWLLGYAIFTVAGVLATGICFSAYTQTAVPHASRTIHQLMTSSIFSAPVSYFYRITPSRLVNRYTGDINIMDFIFSVSLLDFAFAAAYLVGSLVLVCFAVPWLALAMPVLIYVYHLVQRFYVGTSQQFQRLEMSSKTPIISTFSTALSGLVTIRAFGAEDLFLRQGASRLDNSQVPMYYRYAGIRFLRTALGFCTLFLAIGIAILAVALRKSTSAGFLGVTLSQLVGFSQGFQNLILAWTRVENGIVSVERIREVSNAPSESNSGLVVPRNSVKMGKIEFKNVTLRYRDDLEPALRHVSFVVERGEKMGICGRTGSGKSSVILALLAGINPALVEGQILIDDADVKTMSPSALRSSISFVSQSTSLFYLSLRDNLTVGFEHTLRPSDAVIWDALDQVGMREAVARLEGKLDAVMSSDGPEFSRGERQLLCLARVILEKRKIVILDEASSSMDVQTERRLITVLQRCLKDCTCIAVAHRISTIVDFDSVSVLDKGGLVEHGHPRLLIQRRSSHFARLAQSQGITA